MQPVVTSAIRPSAPPAAVDLRSLLVDLVAERTGYPQEMLGLDLDLEADLGVDSIKRVEILTAFQQKTGLLNAEQMEDVGTRRTLQAILDFVSKSSA
jgi:acyl carrier protein